MKIRKQYPKQWNRVGTVLSPNIAGDVNLGDGHKLITDEVRAYDGAGLKLYDDGGNGIFVEDGGNVGVGTITPTHQLEVVNNQGAIYPLYLEGGSGQRAGFVFDKSDASRFLGLLVGSSQAIFKSNTDIHFQNNLAYANKEDGNLASSPALTIKTTGKVGVGTDTPLAPLHVALTASSWVRAIKVGTGSGAINEGNYIEFPSSTADGYGAQIGGERNADGAGKGDLIIKTRLNTQIERVRVTNDGNVGISTAIPRAKLDIGGYLAPRAMGSTTEFPLLISDSVNDVSGVEMGNISTGTGADFRFTIFDTTGNYTALTVPSVNHGSTLFGASRSSSAYLFNNGGTARNLTVGTIAAKDLIFGTTNVERMRILSGGSVGIGTAIPGEKLEVQGATGETYLRIRDSRSTTGDIVGIKFSTTPVPASYDLAKSMIAHTETGAYGLGDMIFAVNPSGTNVDVSITDEVMRIASAGNVGIGTTSPDTKLQVVGNTKFGDDNTNYASFATDGELSLTGTARVTRHLRVGAGQWSHGASAPTAGFDGVFPYMAFDAASDDECHYTVIVPHRLDLTVDVEFVVDWYYTGTQDNGTVCWGVEYKSIKDGEAVTGAGTTITKVSAGTHATGDMVRTTFTTKILASNLECCDSLGLRLYRDVSADTLAVDARLINTHFHFTMDKLGKST